MKTFSDFDPFHGSSCPQLGQEKKNLFFQKPECSRFQIFDFWFLHQRSTEY